MAKKSMRERAQNPLELIHMDSSGIINTPTPEGYQYYLVLVDDCTGFTWVFLMKTGNSTEAAKLFKQWMSWVEKQTGHKVKKIRSDGGGEFQKDFTDLCTDKGLEQIFSAPYNPWQNGKAERAVGILADKTRTCLIKAGLIESFWGHRILHIAWVKNRSPLRHGPTPFERLYERKPNLSRLLTFGCPIVYKEYIKRKKWDPKG